MAKRELLLGDEALALGALHAGLSGVYAYPGTPSTEITEYIQQHPLAAQRNVHRTWSSNEKTAMEEALGMSFAGKRALVCMKHVGLNVAADAFVNSAMTGANGGLVVVAADDPSMHSSQNEQDSRFYGKFALVPTFEPADQQEAYDMAKAAFDLSERFRIPVLMRLTTRMAHSRAVVETGEARAENPLSHPEQPRQWVLMPGNSRVRYQTLLEDYARLEEESAASPTPTNARRWLTVLKTAAGLTTSPSWLAGTESSSAVFTARRTRRCWARASPRRPPWSTNPRWTPAATC